MTTIVTRSGKGSPISASENDANLNNLNNDKVEKTASTGSASIPVGTTAQRDGSPANGMFRYNTTTDEFEGYSESAWGSIGGGGGASADGVIYENATTISNNYTLTSGTNGFSVGAITIATGVTVTIPTGQRWVIL